MSLKTEKSTKFGLNHKKSEIIEKNGVSYIDSSRGLYHRPRRKDVHHRRACDRVWCDGKRGVRRNSLGLHDGIEDSPCWIQQGESH